MRNEEEASKLQFIAAAFIVHRFFIVPRFLHRSAFRIPHSAFSSSFIVFFIAAAFSSL